LFKIKLISNSTLQGVNVRHNWKICGAATGGNNIVDVFESLTSFWTMDTSLLADI